MMNELKPCPNCGSTDLEDLHSYVMCNRCLMCGPKIAGWDSCNSEFIDFGFARKFWNDLPRKAAVNA
jgi:hypothetical protein